MVRQWRDAAGRCCIDVDLDIHPGEVVLLTGPSGCGKTTLLTLVGALRQVMEGSVRVMGQELFRSSRGERQLLRRGIGMIFQGHNLLSFLTSEQNVQMGADLLPGLELPGPSGSGSGSGCGLSDSRTISGSFPMTSRVARSNGWP